MTPYEPIVAVGRIGNPSYRLDGVRNDYKGWPLFFPTPFRQLPQLAEGVCFRDKSNPGSDLDTHPSPPNELAGEGSLPLLVRQKLAVHGHHHPIALRVFLLLHV